MENLTKDIETLTGELLDGALLAMKKKIERALKSGSLNLNEATPLIMAKIITIALLEDEADQYRGKGTSYEKLVAKNVKNLKYFL